MTVGAITSEIPIPLEIPPHDTEYHLQFAPTPKLPPVKLNVVDVPLQIIAGDEEAELAGFEFVQTDKFAVSQFVVLHSPSALT